MTCATLNKSNKRLEKLADACDDVFVAVFVMLIVFQKSNYQNNVLSAKYLALNITTYMQDQKYTEIQSFVFHVNLSLLKKTVVIISFVIPFFLTENHFPNTVAE